MNYDIVVGGGGQGSLTAIVNIAPHWPQVSPAVVVALEEVDQPARSILQIIDGHSPTPVAYAVHGEPVVAGKTYLCPPGKHIFIGQGKVILLDDGNAFNGTKPLINRFFTSAAGVYGKRAIAVLLSGNSRDGVQGLRDIEAAGGVAIVQDPDDALASRMPRMRAS